VYILEMLYVRIEIWPLGSKDHKRLLGEGQISNMGKGTSTKADYEFKLSKFGGFGPKGGNVWKKGVLLNFPRKKLGPWDLLKRAIETARKV
jgi:hypothetical protein